MSLLITFNCVLVIGCKSPKLSFTGAIRFEQSLYLSLSLSGSFRILKDSVDLGHDHQMSCMRDRDPDDGMDSSDRSVMARRLRISHLSEMSGSAEILCSLPFEGVTLTCRKKFKQYLQNTALLNQFIYIVKG